MPRHATAADPTTIPPLDPMRTPVFSMTPTPLPRYGTPEEQAA